MKLMRNLQVVKIGLESEIIQRKAIWFVIPFFSYTGQLIVCSEICCVPRKFVGKIEDRVCTDCVNQSITFNLMRHKRTLSFAMR